MASKVFLDANILLDFALHREHYKEARQLMELIATSGYKGYITSSILHIAAHWITKEKGSEKAKDFLLTLLTGVIVIDIPHERAIVALSSKMSDIEDALQYYAAIHHKMDYFISQDKSLKKQSIPSLPVLTPKEFISVFL